MQTLSIVTFFGLILAHVKEMASEPLGTVARISSVSAVPTDWPKHVIEETFTSHTAGQSEQGAVEVRQVVHVNGREAVATGLRRGEPVTAIILRPTCPRDSNISETFHKMSVLEAKNLYADPSYWYIGDTLEVELEGRTVHDIQENNEENPKNEKNPLLSCYAQFIHKAGSEGVHPKYMYIQRDSSFVYCRKCGPKVGEKFLEQFEEPLQRQPVTFFTDACVRSHQALFPTPVIIRGPGIFSKQKGSPFLQLIGERAFEHKSGHKVDLKA